MRVSVGIDMDEIDRVKRQMEKGDAFVNKVLGPREREYIAAHGNRPQTVCAMFCAKEAFSKALGTGVRNFSLQEVEVLHDDLGKPYYGFSGEAKRIVEEQGLTFDLSITHTDTTAAAVAVAWKE